MSDAVGVYRVLTSVKAAKLADKVNEIRMSHGFIKHILSDITSDGSGRVSTTYTIVYWENP